MEKYDLTGKTALITGGAGLLGVQHAIALLEVGANVVLSDIDDVSLEAALVELQSMTFSGRILTANMDVTKESSVNLLNEKILSEDLSINVLVNNAAIDPKISDGSINVEQSRLENFSIDEWDRQIQVGLTGALICARVFGHQMAKCGGGVIVNVASDLSVFSPDQRLYQKPGVSDESQPVKPVSYSVVKTGLIGLTRYLATYWAKQGVRCNALSPGGIENNQGEDFVERLSALVPMGRMARVDEYRSAIQFLCSDASLYMNGQNLVIDGGRSVL
jgi:NAD(P)-dependent dehydrogenase (short-subunit alcohol dehydrogenase family)